MDIQIPRVMVDLSRDMSMTVEVDRPAPLPAADAAPGRVRMALDRGGSMRTKDVDGRLHVRDCRISKANVCPYLGSEIPDSEALGLDPAKVYNLYRDAAHLEAAVPLFERIPLMMRHISSTADQPNKDVIIGTVGNVRWMAPYVVADLTVWDKDGIEAIESERQQELSPGYRYTPVMTSGVHEGKAHDGSMTKILPNHLAIVDTGRTGPDVMVNDGITNSCAPDFGYVKLRSHAYVTSLDLNTMKLAQILAIAAAGGFIAADKKPADLEAAILAADASLPGNVASSKEIEDSAKAACDAKRSARDKARDKARAAADAKRKEKRDAEDAKISEKRAACDAKRADDRKAMDAKLSKDRADDPECTNDKAMTACDAAMEKEATDEDTMETAADEDYSTAGDPTTPGGNRAKGKTAVDGAEDTATAVAAAIAARDDLHAARAEVAPILGVVTMDSAAEVRRAGLKKLGVDASNVHESALAVTLKMAKDKAATPAVVVAADAATVTGMEKIVPGYGRLK